MLKKITMDNKYYQTSDIALATIISLSFPLVHITPQSSGKSLFVFERNKEMEKLIEDYWSGNLKIEPKTYFNQLKTIKTRLYSEK